MPTDLQISIFIEIGAFTKIADTFDFGDGFLLLTGPSDNRILFKSVH